MIYTIYEISEYRNDLLIKMYEVLKNNKTINIFTTRREALQYIEMIK